MTDSAAEYRKYLDPKVLAKVRALELRARLIVEGIMSGMHRSPFQGSSVEFAQHRQYVAGDDVKHIDWKVLGRSDRIYIKQYQEETNLPIVLVVDASESMGFGSIEHEATRWTKYDCATSIAASLAYMALHQSDAVGLAIFDQVLSRYFKPVSTPTQWKLVINEMQQVPRWNKTSIGNVLDTLAEKIGHRSLVVIVSDFFDDLDALQRGLRHLRYRKHEVVSLQVMDPQEIEFPFNDVTMFKGMEELGDLLTEPRALREGYLASLRTHTEKLKKVCRQMKIDFYAFNSGDPLDAALGNFLASRMSQTR